MLPPQLEPTMPPQLLETVTVELGVTPDGKTFFNVRGSHLQAPPEALWERIIQILQGGLRAAIVQTVAPQAEASRIVAPSGLVLPPSGRH
jgi:hypothetical protein